MKYNRICQILGIEKPVIQGPLSWLTDARLVAAVSNAGGLGVLGPNAGLTAKLLYQRLKKQQKKCVKKFVKPKNLPKNHSG